MIPEDDIARVVDAQTRFDAAIADLTDADVRRASTLPDWTVGHVLSHVARNADSHRRRTEAARRGEVVDQYPGGFEGRAAEIEAGAARPAAELVADVRDSAALMTDAWHAVPDDAWEHRTRDVGGRERPLRELVGRRWQEVEVHLVDLAVGITYRDWPDEFVAVWRPRLRAVFGDQVPAWTGLDDRDELAWLFGRLARPDLPVLAPWG
ncbi:MAG TPA: maleylpyruvate isomerase N-terminal domain-containing protein [Acidimicrobiales bacterium]|nr:maleylpyruvate isomerase N-terminal domain-containing protein [Acidimicrobiales bacterium]